MRVGLAAILAFALLGLAGGSAFAQAGSGIGSGRATGSDVAGLMRDIRQLVEAERAFNRRNDLVDREGMLSRERQNQIFGLTEEIPVGSEETGLTADLALGARRWWIDHVLQPALNIAANPAASCGVAREMLQRILVLERQAQVLGLEEARFGYMGDSDSILGRAAIVVQQRCLAEAYDECMDTGNGRALFKFVGAFRLVDVDPGVLEQAAYLFRRCTVYSLVYHLELDSAVRDVRQSVIADGSYRLLFSAEEGDALTRLATGVWSGPTPREMAAPNVVLSALDCGVAAVSCDLDEPPFGGLAHGRLTMTRYAQPQQIIRIVVETPEERLIGGRIVIEDEPCGGGAGPGGCSEGEDLAAFSFAPPDFITLARLRPGYGPLTRAGPGSDIYYLATRSTGEDLLTIGPWTREGYPLLFTTAVDRTERLPGTRGGLFQAHVRGTFELRHRPDLYPPEEIVPEYELAPNQEPERPPRIPLH